MSDEYFLAVCAKRLKTGILLAIIISLLVFSQVLCPPLTSAKDGYKLYTAPTPEIRVESPYFDYEVGACENDAQHTLESAALSELIKAPTLIKLLVLPSGEYDKDDAFRMINNLFKIPESILTRLLVSGWKIKLINGKLTDEPEYAHLKGVTPRGWEGTGKTWDDLSGLGGYPNVVVNIGYSEKTKGTINLELHETGHAVDCAFNNISKNDSFLKIWKKEVSNLFSDSCNYDYVNNYAEEYFAESFSMYFYNIEGSEKIREQAPLTFELLHQLATS